MLVMAPPQGQHKKSTQQLLAMDSTANNHRSLNVLWLSLHWY